MSSSGDRNGKEDENGDGDEERIGEGGGEAKKRKKPHNICRRHVGNGADLGMNTGWKRGREWEWKREKKLRWERGRGWKRGREPGRDRGRRRRGEEVQETTQEF